MPLGPAKVYGRSLKGAISDERIGPEISRASDIVDG